MFKSAFKSMHIMEAFSTAAVATFWKQSQGKTQYGSLMPGVYYLKQLLWSKKSGSLAWGMGALSFQKGEWAVGKRGIIRTLCSWR